jgi:hypothetical protein
MMYPEVSSSGSDAPPAMPGGATATNDARPILSAAWMSLHMAAATVSTRSVHDALMYPKTHSAFGTPLRSCNTAKSTPGNPHSSGRPQFALYTAT